MNNDAKHKRKEDNQKESLMDTEDETFLTDYSIIIKIPI